MFALKEAMKTLVRVDGFDCAESQPLYPRKKYPIPILSEARWAQGSF
jgi:hypothetical protein